MAQDRTNELLNRPNSQFQVFKQELQSSENLEQYCMKIPKEELCDDFYYSPNLITQEDLIAIKAEQNRSENIDHIFPSSVEIKTEPESETRHYVENCNIESDANEMSCYPVKKEEISEAEFFDRSTLTEEEEIEIKEAEIRFRIRKALSMHMKAVKVKVPLLKCKFCPYRCKLDTNLKRHEESHYTESGVMKIFKCSQCSYETNYQPRLTFHSKLRHGSRDYQCHICSYRTANKEHLSLHLIGHKENKEEQDLRYRCDKCDYKTHRDYNLRIHKLNHLKPEEINYFYCHHCDIKANRKDNLKVHIFKHFKKEEVTLACYICDFTTKKRDKLVCHIQKHTKKLKEAKTKNDTRVATDDNEIKHSKGLKAEQKKRDSRFENDSDEIKSTKNLKEGKQDKSADR